MLRLVHSQTVQGALYIDDIDDGLPNKQVKRLGSTADPNAYGRDGYANAPKQPCYVPRVKAGEPAVAGYIDLDETQRVTHSAFSGKIKGFQDSGFISIVSLTASDLAAPVIGTAVIDTPATGDLSVGGSGFLSVAPDVTTILLWGAGVGGSASAPGLTLTLGDLVTSPSAITDTTLVIDTLDNGALAAGDFVQIRADGQLSNALVIS